MKAIVVLAGTLAWSGALAPPAFADDVKTYYNKAAFLAATSATSATGPLPDVGTVLDSSVDPSGTFTLGSVTFGLTFGSDNVAIGALDTTAAPDWYPQTPGNDMALGWERLQVSTSGPVYSFGFDIVEPDLTMPSFGGTPEESTYEFLLFDGPLLVGHVLFDGTKIPNDVETFIGVWSDKPFDRVVINDISGSDDDEFLGEFYTGTTPSGCTMNLDLSYAGGTFTMNFELGTAAPRTWSVWLFYGESSSARLLSVPLPAVAPAVSFPLAFPLPPIGTVGVLTIAGHAGRGNLVLGLQDGFDDAVDQGSGIGDRRLDPRSSFQAPSPKPQAPSLG